MQSGMQAHESHHLGASSTLLSSEPAPGMSCDEMALSEGPAQLVDSRSSASSQPCLGDSQKQQMTSSDLHLKRLHGAYGPQSNQGTVASLDSQD